jgi:phosphoribosyl 1,2-cyclic phosphate phosphodiesterase
MELIFLGTGAGNGVPVFYCGCKVCREAEADPRCRRTRCAIAVTGEKNILFDAPPEITSQLLREKIDSVDYLFLTHAHNDHTAGLGDLAIYVRFFRGEKLPAFMSRETLTEIETRCGSVQDWLDVTVVEPGQLIIVGDLLVTALDVSHSAGALGYLISYQGSETAYVPDTGPLPDETMQRLADIDRLIIDATFSEDNWYPEEHLTIEAAVELGEKLAAGKLYLTHLSMHYTKPVTCAELEERFRQHNGKVNLAYDGTRLDLTKCDESLAGRHNIRCAAVTADTAER